ncbi:MAG TPA: hypothetical protein VGF55_23550 [Gemmataceae bacterium]|jgi:hypothetical protein
MNDVPDTSRRPPRLPSADARRHTTIEELMAAQGIQGPQDLDSLAAPDLWKDDEEFEQFLAALQESRRQGQ